MYTERAEKAPKGGKNGRLRYAAQAQARDGGTYSCDKVQQTFRLRYGEAQGLLDALGRAGWLTLEHWESRRPGTYGHQFRVCLPEGRSFWLGVGLCEYGKARRGDNCKLEYNPNKVWPERALLWVLVQCWTRARLVEPCTLKAWDLAIDWPGLRQDYRLRKDARVYEERKASAADWTQYCGQRNAPGRCKLYNKQLEAGLADPVTRLEITLGGLWGPQEVRAVWPVVYRLVNAQTGPDVAALNDTDRFILATLLDAPERVRELGRRKGQRMAALLDSLGGPVQLDERAYSKVLAFVARLMERPADLDGARAQWEWHGQGPDWVPPCNDPWPGVTGVPGV